MTVFKIEHIQQEPEWSTVAKWTTSVLAVVEKRCSGHGYLQASLKMEAIGTAKDQNESVRRAVQRLLNHDYYPEMEIDRLKCNCAEPWGKVVYDFSTLQHPWKSLFEDLFKDASWQPPKLQLP